MGQKVHPNGLRVGIVKDWNSKWFAANKKDFAANVVEDKKLRDLVKKELYQARISDIVIERPSDKKIKIIIDTAKPGLVIGKSGAQLEKTKSLISKKMGLDVEIAVNEIRKPDLDGQVVAENIGQQLENRVSFRKAMKQAMQRTMKSGAKGIKVAVSGRLGGAEMARTEFYSEGTVPLQTIRGDIDYGFAKAQTTYGTFGVKVWIYRGEVLGNKIERMQKIRKGENPRGNRSQNRRRDGKRNFDRKPRRNNAVNTGAKEVSGNAVNAKES